ncbi:hypothetical protein BDV10DRAFT_94470 [Aspergillus recurvatus]
MIFFHVRSLSKFLSARLTCISSKLFEPLNSGGNWCGWGSGWSGWRRLFPTTASPQPLFGLSRSRRVMSHTIHVLYLTFALVCVIYVVWVIPFHTSVIPLSPQTPKSFTARPDSR